MTKTLARQAVKIAKWKSDTGHGIDHVPERVAEHIIFARFCNSFAVSSYRSVTNLS